MEKNCFSTITGKKFGGFYAICKDSRKIFDEADWNHFILNRWALGGNIAASMSMSFLIATSFPFLRREIYILLHSWTVKKRPFCDTIWSGLQNFFLELLKTRNLGSATALIHHIPKLNMTASTGILNLSVRKPCLLIFFSVVEEEVASRVILLKMTVCLLGTHFPNPMNVARTLRLSEVLCLKKILKITSSAPTFASPGTAYPPACS